MTADYFQMHGESSAARTSAWRGRGVFIAGGAVFVLLTVVGLKVFVSPAALIAKDPMRADRTQRPKLDVREHIALPVIPGHHDRISRDPFQTTTGQRPVKAPVASRSQASRTNKVSDAPFGLKLKAIALGAKPKAFINNTFVSEGETLAVAGLEEKTCRVISIDERAVTVQVGEGTQVLRLASETDLDEENWGF